MIRLLRLVVPLGAALAIAACNAGSSTNVPSTAGAAQALAPMSHAVPQWEAKHQALPACKELAGGVSCHALLSLYHAGPLACSPSSTCGFRPIDLQTRYDLASSLNKGSGTIVAVIELGDEPNAANDLATYRSQFGLGTAPFAKYNQYGQQSNYPESCADFGFCLEADLDTEMVAAMCPKCTIYMIEGGNCGGGVCGLEGAEAEAVTLGATIISNSWGCRTGVYGPNCGDPNFSTYFSTPNIAYLASSGDSAYPEIEWPAALQNVLAVGGTQLAKSGSTFTETVWADAGAGCATTVTKPSWQHDPDCAGRTIADVSAQAGCSPPVAEYDTGPGYAGWVGACGTSVASPLTAGIVALAGNSASLFGGKTFWKFTKTQHKRKFFDISSGSDGSCGGEYLCEAGAPHPYKTYSGPAGWGTPKGIKGY